MAEKLRESGINISGKEWLAGFLFSMIVPVLPFLIPWVISPSPLGNLHLPMVGLLAGSLAAFAFQIYPEAKATSDAARAQTDVAITISVLSFSLYHRPDLRGAVARAAEATDGKLAKDLRLGLLEMSQHRRYESTRHLIMDVADRWGRKNESVRQAFFDILRSTGACDEESRVSDVMKAPSRVLEASEERLSAKLNSMVLPTIAFLTFGSILIVVAIGLSPIFGMVGRSFSDLRFFAGLMSVVVLIFLLFSLYMTSRRPSTLYPILLVSGGGRPSKRSFLRVLLIPAVAVIISLPGILYLAGFRTGFLGVMTMSLSTLWIVLAVGSGLCLYGSLFYSPLLDAREKERRRIADWEDALNLIGSKMLDGKSAGRAMIETSELIGGELSKDLRAAGERMEKGGIEMERAMCRRENPLIQSFLSQISKLRRESEMAAGRACMVAAEFIHMLRRTEQRFRERMNEVLGNLWMVSVILVPVVCAMSVWIMDFMSGMKHSLVAQASAAGVSGFPFMIGALETSELAALRLLMGLTAIALSAIIAWFISNIRAPGDRVEMWMSIAKSSLISSLVFTLSTIVLLLIVPGSYPGF
jgi:hypothetical protein